MWLSGWEGWDPKRAPWWHPKHGSDKPKKARYELTHPWGKGMHIPKQPKKENPKPEASPEDTIADREAARLFEWRFDYFKRIGFGASDAELLADSRNVDTHEVEKMVKMGCPISLALEILL